MFYKEHEQRRIYSNCINKYDCGARITVRDILLEVLSTKEDNYSPYQDRVRGNEVFNQMMKQQLKS